MPKFIVRDRRFGNIYRTGLNGRIFALEVDAKLEADQGLIDHLLDLGADIEVLDGPSKGAGSSSEEGSVEVEPVPIHAPIAKDAKLSDALVAEELAAREEAEPAVATEPEPAPKKAATPKKKVATKAKKK